MPIFQQLGLSLAGLHPGTSWGPLLCWASPCPSHKHLPTSASSTFPLTGVSTSTDQTVLGVTSEGPGTQPSRVRSTHVGPEPRPASCPQHRHAESPRGPHQPGCGNPSPQRRSVLRHRAHALPSIRRGVDERHRSRCRPLAGPAPQQHPEPRGQVRSPCSASGSKSRGRCTHSWPTETGLQVTKPGEQLAVCSSSAHARAGGGAVTKPCGSAPHGGRRCPGSRSGRRPSVWVRGGLGSPQSPRSGPRTADTPALSLCTHRLPHTETSSRPDPRPLFWSRIRTGGRAVGQGRPGAWVGLGVGVRTSLEPQDPWTRIHGAGSRPGAWELTLVTVSMEWPHTHDPGTCLQRSPPDRGR